MERKVWTIQALVAAAQHAVEREFPLVWVRGEVSGFRPHASGHWYFDLKGGDAVLSIVMFRGANIGVPFALKQGLEVILGGKLTIYRARGIFQLVAEVIEPVGWGALQLAFEQLRAQLAARGFFDPERKRELPLLPETVGVVTSESGAAWHDLTQTWRRRGVGLRVVLAPTRVQGDSAALELADSLHALDRWGQAEVLIVTRGGGSREDLWAFNEEPVVQAIAASQTPVISAVGHEIDVTLADLAADRRAATPTAAAEIVAPSRNVLERRLEAAQRRSLAGVRRRLLKARAQLDKPHLRRVVTGPRQLVQSWSQRLDEGWDRLQGAFQTGIEWRQRRLERSRRTIALEAPVRRLLVARSHLQAARHAAQNAIERAVAERCERLGVAAARIEALSPLAVLARGYSICQSHRTGTILRSHREVIVGDRLNVRLARGELDCKVLDRRARVKSD